MEPPPLAAGSVVSRSWVTRYARGTSSMSKKSRHEELKKVAVGSEALYGGTMGSRDMMTEAVNRMAIGSSGEGGNTGSYLV